MDLSSGPSGHLKGMFTGDAESLANLSLSMCEISKDDLHPNPASGFKKLQLPTLRDRNRQLLSERIAIQNVNVNKSYRRYVN